jgi:uncharacterized protein (TIRG00374 family)
MIKFLFGATSFFIGIAILVAVILTVGIGEIVRVFLQFSPWGMVPLVLLTIAFHLISAIKWQYILRVMGVQTSLISVLKIWLVGYAVSYITPVVYIGGEIFRSHILHEKYNVSWRKSLSSVAVDKASESIVWILTMFIGIIAFIMQSGIFAASSMVVSSVAIMAFFTFLVALVYFFIFKKKSLLSVLILKPLGLEATKGGRFLLEAELLLFNFFSLENKKCISWTFVLTIFKFILLWIRNIFLIYYLVRVISLSGGVIALGFSSVSYSLPIPAALGAQEALLSLAFAGIDFDSSTGTVFSFLMRGAEFMAVGAGLFFLMRWGLGKFAFHIVQWIKTKALNGNGSV